VVAEENSTSFPKVGHGVASGRKHYCEKKGGEPTQTLRDFTKKTQQNNEQESRGKIKPPPRGDDSGPDSRRKTYEGGGGGGGPRTAQ